MKKFLSLLLALTLVLSLVVVPARADADTLSGVSLSNNNLTLEVGASTGNELTVNASSLTYGDSAQVPDDATAAYVWSSSDNTVATVAAKDESTNKNVGVITALKKSALPITISCAVTYSWTATESPERAAGSATATLSCSLTVNDNAGDLRNAITNVTYNSREYYNSTSKSVAAYKFSEDVSDTWGVTATGYAVSSVSFDSTTGLNITATKDSGGGSVTATVPCTLTTVSVTVTAKPTTVEKDNGTATLTATATAVPGATITYEWKNGGTLLNGNSATLQLVKPSAQASITCKAIYTFAGNVTKSVSTSAATIIAIDTATYTWSGVPATALNMAKGDTDNTTLPTIELVNSANTSAAATGVTYSYSSSNTSAVTVSDAGVITAVGNGPAAITITAKDSTATDALYRGKSYTTTVTVSSTALESELTSVANGNSQYYYMSTLNSAAREKIAARLGSTATNVTVTNLTMKTGSYAQTLLGGTLNTTNISANGGYITYSAPKSTLGKANFVMTATATYTQGGTQKNANFDVTFVIPVTPIYSQSFEAQYPQPVSSVGSSYTYTVTPPHRL